MADLPRWTDADVWYSLIAGGLLRVDRIRRPGLPETEREMAWLAHERGEERRGSRIE